MGAHGRVLAWLLESSEPARWPAWSDSELGLGTRNSELGLGLGTRSRVRSRSRNSVSVSDSGSVSVSVSVSVSAYGGSQGRQASVTVAAGSMITGRRGAFAR